MELAAERGRDRKIAIAAAFHDLGIWPDHTFDYLAPSVRLTSAWLADSDRATWTSEVTEMTSTTRADPYREGRTGRRAFRRADWVDVMMAC